MQHNLLLGIFIPSEHGPHIWDLEDDEYLHNAPETFYRENPQYVSPIAKQAASDNDTKEKFEWLPDSL